MLEPLALEFIYLLGQNFLCIPFYPDKLECDAEMFRARFRFDTIDPGLLHRHHMALVWCGNIELQALEHLLLRELGFVFILANAIDPSQTQVFDLHPDFAFFDDELGERVKYHFDAKIVSLLIPLDKGGEV